MPIVITEVVMPEERKKRGAAPEPALPPHPPMERGKKQHQCLSNMFVTYTPEKRGEPLSRKYPSTPERRRGGRKGKRVQA